MNNATDTGILFPDKTILIGDEKVTVREFKYLEGLKMAAEAGPLLSSLGALFKESGADFELSALDNVIADHLDAWAFLVASSCDKTPEWLANLSDTDGSALGWAFWEVNGPFLLRRVAFARRFSGQLVA